MTFSPVLYIRETKFPTYVKREFKVNNLLGKRLEVARIKAKMMQKEAGKKQG